MTKIQFHIKKSRFSVKSRFKEPTCADRGHSLNRDFTVMEIGSTESSSIKRCELLTEVYCNWSLPPPQKKEYLRAIVDLRRAAAAGKNKVFITRLVTRGAF